MNIAWLYLDKRGAAINALKDYKSMKYISKNVQQDINERNQDMISVGNAVITELPRNTTNPGANENRIVKMIDEINVLQEQRKKAQEYMGWFEPAWNFLSDEERFVLDRFYIEEDTRQTDAIGDICDRFHIERSSAYKKKDRALSHLTLLLFGK